MKRKWIIIAAAIAVAVIAVVLIVCLCGRNEFAHALPAEEAAEEETVELLFGIDKQRYDIEQGIVREGETAGQILARITGVGRPAPSTGSPKRPNRSSVSRISGSAKPFTVFSREQTSPALRPFRLTSRRRPTT